MQSETHLQSPWLQAPPTPPAKADRENINGKKKHGFYMLLPCKCSRFHPFPIYCPFIKFEGKIGKGWEKASEPDTKQHFGSVEAPWKHAKMSQLNSVSVFHPNNSGAYSWFMLVLYISLHDPPKIQIVFIYIYIHTNTTFTIHLYCNIYIY